MLVSNSEGLWREGLVGAILLRAAMAVVLSMEESSASRSAETKKLCGDRLA
jgi:hypothetical protein